MKAKLEVTPIWSGDEGLCLKLVGLDWMGVNTPDKMRELAKYVNECLKEYEVQ